VKISNTKIVVNTELTLASINSINDEEMEKIFNLDYPNDTNIEKQTVQKIIETINIDNDGAVIRLINGKEFLILRPSKKNIS